MLQSLQVNNTNLCQEVGHKNNQVKFICLYQKCQSQKKFGCFYCMRSCLHAEHYSETKEMDELLSECKSYYEQNKISQEKINNFLQTKFEKLYSYQDTIQKDNLLLQQQSIQTITQQSLTDLIELIVSYKQGKHKQLQQNIKKELEYLDSLFKNTINSTQQEVQQNTNDTQNQTPTIQQITQQQSNHGPQEIQIYFEAIRLFDEEKYEEASKILKQLVDISPNNDGYLNLYGLSLFHLSEYQNALTIFDKQLVQQPNNIRAFVNKMFIHIQFQQYEFVLTQLNQKIEQNPKSFLLFFCKGHCLNFLKKNDDALIAFFQADELQQNPDVKKEIANLMVQSGEIENAINYFKESITCGYKYPEKLILVIEQLEKAIKK